MEGVGIVGLGIMGSAYARNLIGAGFPVTGNDVDPERMTALRELGGNTEDSPAGVAATAKVILLALPSVTALDDVVTGPDGLANGARGGTIVVEMGTFPLEAKERVRRVLDETGVETVDAPVSGTGLQAERAEIVIYASGDTSAIESLHPCFDAIAQGVFDVGPFGNGSKMKYLANLLVSVHNLATAEAFVLGKAAGLEPSAILEVISAGVGSSRIFEIRGPMIAADSYPPAARLRMFLKDIDVIAGFARSLRVPTPLLDASLPWYEDAVAEGLGDLDAAALARVLAARAGEDL
jgi:putative dehydrogenase